MRLKFYLLIIFYCLALQMLYAQNDIYKFSHIDITNGLSDNQVNCIYREGNGFVWFGTLSGLDRYDGYKFKVFKHDPRDPRSLGENNVITINPGPNNKMWVFTHSGISIYDPVTEKFSTDVSGALAQLKIPENQIRSIRKDHEGNYWFLTVNRGLYCYNPQISKTTFFNNAPNSSTLIHSNTVMDIVGLNRNIVWLLYNDGLIEQMDTKTNKILSSYNGFAKAVSNVPQICNLAADNRGNLWIYASAGPIGAYCYNIEQKTLMHFSKDEPLNKLNSNVINSIVQADDNKIWLGTDHGGINVIDPDTHKINYILKKEDDPKSLTGNSIVLFKDKPGIIWAGTFKQGINYYHRGILQFPLYTHFTTDKNSLPFEDVNCFVEDKIGNLWIGTNGGGLIYFNRRDNTYTQYRHNPSNANSLANDVVVRLLIGHDNKLWIGMYFGGLDYFENNKFVHHRHNEKTPASITDDRVYTILEDSKQNIWAGTFAGGLNIYDPVSDSFLHPKYYQGPYYTSVIYEDHEKNIWIGRDIGVNMIDPRTDEVKHYFSMSNNPNSLVANDVNTLMEDSRGLMWIGTKDGLSILNLKTDKFLSSADGFNFPSSNVSNILEDNDGTMWVSTNNGLANIKIIRNADKYQFAKMEFNEFDGLQARGYNLNAALKMKSGELIFGGAHGFNLFFPEKVNTTRSSANLVFTDFQLFNKSVRVGDTIMGNIILKKSIAQTGEITLNHDENVFGIEFAACDYFNPDKTKYQYTLEGFDNGWITSPANNRKAVYTNLDAGSYTFKVKASNSNNLSESSTISLKIIVLPPFWKTTLAYLIYFISGMALLFYVRHRGIVKLEKQFEQKQEKIEEERKIANEREEARRMHQLDLMKIKFFTNVSHEFRTPLSLILSPIDNLIKIADKPEQQHHLIMIKRNGKRLLNLVNQLLDFRKMEFNELKLCLKKGDIIKFMQEVTSSFIDVARQKQIELLFESDVISFVTNFDHDKIERVLFNLLSNALKFTPSGGHISVMVSQVAQSLPGDEQKNLEIKVIDTGIGIPIENQEKIFERFFQDNLPESLLNQGSGIGLSITKEFVKMHDGSISIESEPDYGTCFIIKLPLKDFSDALANEIAFITEPFNFEPKGSEETQDKYSASKKPAILIIEDNDDLRFYLKDNLKQLFHIIEANNGKEGWQKALALHPQIIVSDISMPEMNGLELCKKIKSDSRTTHIPVILLTALTAENDQLAGLESGANDYIVKPFNFEILLSKIHNLLRMQHTMKQTYQKQIEINSKEIHVVSEDDKFLQNAIDYIEKNITNPNFSVEELSRHLNLSRVSLYKKLLTLTGKTPVDCIRTIRLKRATQLLEKSKLSIANVAYEAGFNNAAYFAKVFREEYGLLPSEYLARINNKETELPVV